MLAPASLEVRCATPVPNRSILSVNVAAKVCQPQVVSYWANNSFFFLLQILPNRYRFVLGQPFLYLISECLFLISGKILTRNGGQDRD